MKEWLLVVAIVVPIVLVAFAVSYGIVEYFMVPIIQAGVIEQ